MTLRNTITSYGSVTKFFHWTLSVLVIGMLIFGFLLGYVPKAYQPTTYNLHKLTGLLILVLMILRLLWTLINPKPLLPADTPWYEQVAERTVHWLIYITLIAMPLSGWIGSAAANRPPKLGSYSFNLPIEQDKVLTGSAFDLHETLAWVIITLLVLHVFAAFYHHLVKKDNILRRMLPGK